MPTLSLPKDAKQLKKIDKLLEIRDKRIEFATKHHRTNKGTRLVFSDMPYLRDIYNTLAEEMVIQSSVQCQPLGSSVLTPKGWRRLSDLDVGSSVCSPGGGVSRVLEVYYQNRPQNIYRVVLSDGRFAECSDNHEWRVYGRDAVYDLLGRWEVITTSEMLARSTCFWEFDIPIVSESDYKNLRALRLDHIEFSRQEPVFGIRVSHPSNLYITDDYLVTKNSGKTEFLIVDHFAHAACGLDLFYVMPKYELRNRFVQNRVDKSIAYSPEYKKYASKGRNKVSLDSCSLKSFGDRTIIYAGSNTTADFREAPADAAFVDEMQECDLNNLQLLTDRLTFSDYKFRKWAGNPQVSGCDINFEYNLSDQRAWNVPCKSCGKLSILDWFETVVDGQMDGSGIIHRYHLRDKEWSPGRFRDIHAICPHCGGILDRFTNGKWIPRADNLREGYWISKLITGKTPFMELWTQFQGCLDSQTLLQWFYNSNLGLPFATQGSQLTANMLDDCATLPAFVVSGRECFTLDKKHPGPCSMGVDVGKFFDVRISFPTNGERHAVFIGKVQSIEDLHELIERFHVQVCVIDAGPDIHTIPEFQDTAKCDVWTCKYSPSEGQDGYPKYNSKDMRIVVDRTFILDKGHSHLKRRINKLPVNYRALLEGAYIAEMTSSVRKLVMTANGNNRFEWRCNSDAIADHQRHADAYDILAFDMMDVGSSGFAFEVF